MKEDVVVELPAAPSRHVMERELDYWSGYADRYSNESGNKYDKPAVPADVERARAIRDTLKWVLGGGGSLRGPEGS